MKNYKKYIDDFFREKLGNYRETPPPEVWDDLETRLDGLLPDMQHFSYRWLRHFAIVSLILLLGVSLVKKISGNSASENTPMNEKPIAKVQVGIPATGITADKSLVKGEDGVSAENNMPDKKVNEKLEKSMAIDQQSKTNKHSNNNINSHNRITIANKQPSQNKFHASVKLNNEPLQTENIYQGNSSKTGPAEGTSESTQALGFNVNTSASQKSVLPGTFKKEKPDNSKTKASEKVGDAHNKPALHKFEAGIKGGYERGFYDDAATKFVAAPYLQYNINHRFSIMVQPAIKSSTISTRKIGRPQSNYKSNNDSNATLSGNPVVSYIVEGGSTTDTLYTTKYTYTQTHDSIVKSYTYGGSYLEFEFPILLKYNISQNVSVYGGVNINYSKLLGIKENIYTKQGIKISIDSTNTTSGAPNHLSINSVIIQSTQNSNNDGSLYATPSGGLIRVGYMLGFSYEYSDRWLFDALIQQTPVKPYMQGGYNTNTSVSSAYFRLSVGYKLIK